MPSTYLRIEPHQIAPDAILVGDPARVQVAAEHLSAITAQGKNREYSWVTGIARATGKPVTVVACGIGAPAWAIALTELHAAGARRFVRVGTALTPLLPLSTIALARSVLRCDRVSEDYLPLHVPVLPDADLMQALHRAFRPEDGPVAEVLFASFSTFYGEMEPLPLGGGAAAPGGLDQREFRRALATGAQAVDMETGLVLAFAQRFGAAAASVCLCTVTGDGGPVLDKETQRDREQTLIAGVLAALAATWR
ncbi:MAG: hypothetical protein DIU70_003175 [Bacillota bacterium]